MDEYLLVSVDITLPNRSSSTIYNHAIDRRALDDIGRWRAARDAMALCTDQYDAPYRAYMAGETKLQVDRVVKVVSESIAWALVHELERYERR
jgi:hypothetical protein